MYLLDTNILIYYLRGDKAAIDFLNDLCQSRFSISIVTRLELLLGYQKESMSIIELEKVLDECDNIFLDKRIVKEAVRLKSIKKTKLKFKDLIIGATANIAKKILVTADKDFQKLDGVKIVYYSSTYDTV